jgi:hypothetical protein
LRRSSYGIRTSPLMSRCGDLMSFPIIRLQLQMAGPAKKGSTAAV